MPRPEASNSPSLLKSFGVIGPEGFFSTWRKPSTSTISKLIRWFGGKPPGGGFTSSLMSPVLIGGFWTLFPKGLSVVGFVGGFVGGFWTLFPNGLSVVGFVGGCGRGGGVIVGGRAG